MMGFHSYEGVPDSVLDKQHTTSTGETYSLRHNESLKVEMPYLGKGNANANSQGWERNSAKYFEALYQNHPEMFSKKNIIRIKEGHAPVVDQKMISSNPNWAQYRNQALVHHHIGGNGEAVAVPKNAHKGQGEIHNQEKSAGITDNCRSFSQKCAAWANSVGKTTSQIHTEMGSKAKTSGQIKSGSAATAGSPAKTSKPTKRSGSVRSGASAKQAASQTTRGRAVRNAVKSSGAGVSSGRSASVRNSMGSGSHATGRSGNGQSSGIGAGQGK